MFDRQIRKVIDPLLDRPAQVLQRVGVTANQVTVAGFLCGLAACFAASMNSLPAALTLLTLNRIADGIDGALARRTAPTDVGGFLDIVLDMIFYSAFPLAFAVAESDRFPAAAFLVQSFAGTGGSFLAYATIAAKRGITSDRLRKKSFFYSVGFMEGAETIIVFVLFCLLPSHFNTLAWTFTTLCWLTTAIRIATAVIVFRLPHNPAETSPDAEHSVGRGR